MANYFSQFPLIAYSLGTSPARLVTDILASVRLMQDMPTRLEDMLTPYIIKDGETPEMFAYRVYGAASAYWVALISSGRLKPSMWPLSNDDLLSLAERQYGSDYRILKVLVDADLNVLPIKIRNSFLDQNGVVVNWYNNGLVKGYGAEVNDILFYNGPLQFLTDVLEQKNDALRKVSVVNPAYLNDFIGQFQSLLASRPAPA